MQTLFKFKNLKQVLDANFFRKPRQSLVPNIRMYMQQSANCETFLW